MSLSMSLCVLMPGAIGLIYLLAVLEVGDGVFEVLSTSGDTHLGGDDFDKVCIFSFIPTKCCCDLIEQSNSKPLVPARGHLQVLYSCRELLIGLLQISRRMKVLIF